MEEVGGSGEVARERGGPGGGWDETEDYGEMKRELGRAHII